jgi:CoA:oxalate CoA-transferase
MGMLDGYRVVDFTNFVSGPTCTRLLADQGAEVIRVERPDKKKGSGPYYGNERTVDLGLMRGKKSITLNSKDSQEHEILVKLIKRSDIIVENFRPGVTKRMGISFDDVVKIKPDIIYTSISGFGQNGPYHDRGAFDIIAESMSGFMSITGEKDGPPLRAGASIADIFSGICSAYATVAMLLNREKTGRGNHVDVAMLDVMFAVCNNPVTQYLNSGIVAGRLGNGHPQDVPWGDFPTVDSSLIIASARTNTFASLCKVLGCPQYIDDQRFCNDDARLVNRDVCHEMVRSYTKKWKTNDLIEALNKAGVPCSKINTIDEACKDESILARGMIATLTHKTAGTYKLPNSVFKFTNNPVHLTKGAPILGENNREIFGSLGMSKEDIDTLLRKQAKVRTVFKEFEMG